MTLRTCAKVEVVVVTGERYLQLVQIPLSYMPVPFLVALHTVRIVVFPLVSVIVMAMAVAVTAVSTARRHPFSLRLFLTLAATGIRLIVGVHVIRVLALRRCRCRCCLGGCLERAEGILVIVNRAGVRHTLSIHHSQNICAADATYGYSRGSGTRPAQSIFRQKWAELNLAENTKRSNWPPLLRDIPP